MIKAVAHGEDGHDTLILGLEEGNLVRLKEGRPMKIDGKKLGIKVDVVIFYGKTAADCYRQLKASGVKLPVPQIAPGDGCDD